MTRAEAGAFKILKGLGIAVLSVVALVLVAVYWEPVLDTIVATWNYLIDRIPTDGGQRTAVLVYLIAAVVLGILFSQAGHFTAYGIAMGLVPLLWVLFWEGFPPLGLHPVWTSNMGITHLSPSQVALWAVVAAVVTTLVFVPLEYREKFQRHRRARRG
ncbi:hypothetical protein ACFQY4_28940 [Catellatospora bangladeshensis]|uniref:Uncharacterized protein n=1 Tax=Catellatospora bangladeshensis TaxID=310355 RepID=A0A8J3JH55_9ACTN|nr:hypothetical protein [Catellatospora bangladeshensis]GIF80588.1 hypothetical protein Cba03nite_19370 [Catellatospora bangladeshensis]